MSENEREREWEREGSLRMCGMRVGLRRRSVLLSSRRFCDSSTSASAGQLGPGEGGPRGRIPHSSHVRRGDEKTPKIKCRKVTGTWNSMEFGYQCSLVNLKALAQESSQETTRLGSNIRSH